MNISSSQEVALENAIIKACIGTGPGETEVTLPGGIPAIVIAKQSKLDWGSTQYAVYLRPKVRSIDLKGLPSKQAHGSALVTIRQFGGPSCGILHIGNKIAKEWRAVRK